MGKGIPKKQVERARSLDLLSYFMNYDPDELDRKSRNEYRTKKYSSLVLSNGGWKSFTRGCSGYSALDFFIKHEKMSFLDACHKILDLMDSKEPVLVPFKQKQKYDFYLPKESINNNKVIDYLVNKRCIDREIVQDFIEIGLIYEADKDHSVVFIGQNIFGEAKHATKRSIDGNWKRDVAGSNKRFSFSYYGRQSNQLHVFEAPIDLLSYLTIIKQKGLDYKQGNYVSINGAFKFPEDRTNMVLPVALEQYLLNHTDIKGIRLHLDNDQTGQECSEIIRILLHEKYEVINDSPTKYKDINDMLVKSTMIKKLEMIR